MLKKNTMNRTQKKEYINKLKQFIIGVKVDNNIIVDSNWTNVCKISVAAKKNVIMFNGSLHILRFCGMPQSVNLLYRVNNFFFGRVAVPYKWKMLHWNTIGKTITIEPEKLYERLKEYKYGKIQWFSFSSAIIFLCVTMNLNLRNI